MTSGGDYRQWSTHQVKEWAIKVAKVREEDAQLLVHHQVDGSIIHMFEESNFRNCGIVVGSSMKLYMSLQQLLSTETQTLLENPETTTSSLQHHTTTTNPASSTISQKLSPIEFLKNNYGYAEDLQTYINILSKEFIDESFIVTDKQEGLTKLGIPAGIASALVKYYVSCSDINPQHIKQFVTLNSLTNECVAIGGSKFSAEDLPFTGRDGVLHYLKGIMGKNIISFTKNRGTKQYYSIPTVIGGIGIGKTRIAQETFLSLRYDHSFLSQHQFDKLWYVRFDFSTLDKPRVGENASQFIGRCLASRFFYGTGGIHADQRLPTASVQEVVNLIDELFVHKKGKRALLFLHLDEYFDLPMPFLSEVISCLSSLMLHPLASEDTEVIHNICVFPIMTGTDLDASNSSLHFSNLIPRNIRLGPLNDKDVRSILIGSSDKWRTVFDKMEYHSSVVISSLGGVPRLVEAFILACEGSEFQHDNIECLKKILDGTTTQISTIYGIDTWNKVFGSTLAGLRTLIKVALNSCPVNRNFPLNGKTVGQVESTGLLMLIKDGTGANILDHPSTSTIIDTDEKYTVHLPLALLRAINKELKDVEDRILDPCYRVNSTDFEELMMPQIRIYRQNLYFSLKIPVTVRDLYPGAIGFDSTLSLTVPIQHLEIVHSEEGITRIPPTTISILSSPPQIVDIAANGVFIINKPKTSYADSIIYHSQSFIETIQYKSSANISMHTAPNASSRGVVSLPDIVTEWNKINGSVSLPGCTVLFPFISNKPLLVDSQIRDNTVFNKLVNYFSDPSNEGKAFHHNGRNYEIPHRIVLVVNENFARYVSFFSSPSLYILYSIN